MTTSVDPQDGNERLCIIPRLRHGNQQCERSLVGVDESWIRKTYCSFTLPGHFDPPIDPSSCLQRVLVEVAILVCARGLTIHKPLNELPLRE